jgi:hypothetical protein
LAGDVFCFSPTLSIALSLTSITIRNCYCNEESRERSGFYFTLSESPSTLFLSTAPFASNPVSNGTNIFLKRSSLPSADILPSFPLFPLLSETNKIKTSWRNGSTHSVQAIDHFIIIDGYSGAVVDISYLNSGDKSYCGTSQYASRTISEGI